MCVETTEAGVDHYWEKLHYDSASETCQAYQSCETRQFKCRETRLALWDKLCAECGVPTVQDTFSTSNVCSKEKLCFKCNVNRTGLKYHHRPQSGQVKDKYCDIESFCLDYKTCDISKNQCINQCINPLHCLHGDDLVPLTQYRLYNKTWEYNCCFNRVKCTSGQDKGKTMDKQDQADRVDFSKEKPEIIDGNIEESAGQIGYNVTGSGDSSMHRLIGSSNDGLTCQHRETICDKRHLIYNSQTMHENVDKFQLLQPQNGVKAGICDNLDIFSHLEYPDISRDYGSSSRFSRHPGHCTYQSPLFSSLRTLTGSLLLQLFLITQSLLLVTAKSLPVGCKWT